MGCKQSKYAVGDDGQQYMDGHEHYKENPNDMDPMHPMHPPGIQTDIIQTHRYVGQYPDQEGQQQLMSNQAQPVDNTWCPSDQQYAQMAENCTSGIFEMFSLNGNKKMIANGPSQTNAYQQPAYNYQTPPSSEQSLGNHSQAHSHQSSQRRAVLVQNGSFSL